MLTNFCRNSKFFSSGMELGSCPLQSFDNRRGYKDKTIFYHSPSPHPLVPPAPPKSPLLHA